MKKRKYVILIVMCLAIATLTVAILFAISHKQDSHMENNNVDNNSTTIVFDLNTKNIENIISSAISINELADYTEYAIEGNYNDIEGEYKYRIKDGEIIYNEFRCVPMLVKAEEVETENGDTIGVYDENEIEAGYKNVDTTVQKIIENDDLTITEIIEIDYENNVKKIDKLPTGKQMRDNFETEPQVYAYVIYATTKSGENHSIAFFSAGLYSITMSVIKV